MLMLLTLFSNLDAEDTGQDEVLPGMQSFFDNEMGGEGFWQNANFFLRLLAFSNQNGKI